MCFSGSSKAFVSEDNDVMTPFFLHHGCVGVCNPITAAVELFIKCKCSLENAFSPNQTAQVATHTSTREKSFTALMADGMAYQEPDLLFQSDMKEHKT